MTKKLKHYAKENDIPIIIDEGLEFLLNTIKECKAKDILEVGSAIGFSSIQMATSNKDIKIVTIEKDIKRYHLAIKNIKEKNLSERIKVINLDANDYKSDKVFDLIFLDGPKSQYGNMLNHLYDNLKEGGAVVVDNLGFHGLVYKKKPKVKRRTRQLIEKIQKFRKDIKEDHRFDVKIYDDIGDGMGLLIKKKVDKYEKNRKETP